MNTGWWTASVSNSKVSGHFKGFDPLQRCFLSLFLLPAPLWVTATGETKTSWMENFLIDRNDSLVSFNPPVFPLKPVRPVRSQCGSVCSQPASLSLLCTTNNWFLRARFQTCCLRLKSELKLAGSSSSAGLTDGQSLKYKTTVFSVCMSWLLNPLRLSICDFKNT